MTVVPLTPEILYNLAEQWPTPIVGQSPTARKKIADFVMTFGYSENELALGFVKWCATEGGFEYDPIPQYYTTELHAKFPSEKAATLFLLRWA